MNSLTLDATSDAATPVVKPTDRDGFAEKSDEPGSFQLSDYADPDAAIASICLSEPCNVISDDSSPKPQNLRVSHGESQVWSLLHPSKGRNMEAPCKNPEGPEVGA